MAKIIKGIFTILGAIGLVIIGIPGLGCLLEYGPIEMFKYFLAVLYELTLGNIFGLIIIGVLAVRLIKWIIVRTFFTIDLF